MSLTIQSLSNLYDAALALVYPQACAVCNGSVESRVDGVTCAACWQAARLIREDDTLCWKCGVHTPAWINEARRQMIRCRRCEDDSFDVARACGLYEGALRAAVLELKRQPRVAPRLSRMMLATQQREPLNAAEVIVPVPLHPAREGQRGFNQALLLARELARLSHLPLDEYSVVRSLHTERHRAGMDSKARRKSVAGAFAVRHRDLIEGRRILLIDDVYTTGATVSECAAVLKESGAAEVFVLTLARASSASGL